MLDKSKIIHYDLFAGIGGFSLAFDNIIGKENAKHIFIERDSFCQLVLKKHWPEAEYHSCIHEFNSYTKHARLERREQNKTSRHIGFGSGEFGDKTQIILTGGFPCQPFSQAGRRQGTADDRYLWPAMFESIKLIRPDWIIAENVAGLVSWSEGLVLEQVCFDLESEDYEVQPFIIPACAVNAPHRRDRVWIVANRKSGGKRSSESERDCSRQSKEKIGNGYRNATNAEHDGFDGAKDGESYNQGNDRNKKRANEFCKFEGANSLRTEAPNWNQNWIEVATSLCRIHDGLPRRLDRNPRLKALGNAIVPQVAEEIFKAISQILKNEK